MGEKLEEGWIIAGILGSSTPHVLHIQFRKCPNYAMLSVEGLFEELKWIEPIYLTRLTALTVLEKLTLQRLATIRADIRTAGGS